MWVLEARAVAADAALAPVVRRYWLGLGRCHVGRADIRANSLRGAIEMVKTVSLAKYSSISRNVAELNVREGSVGEDMPPEQETILEATVELQAMTVDGKRYKRGAVVRLRPGSELVVASGVTLHVDYLQLKVCLRDLALKRDKMLREVLDALRVRTGSDGLGDDTLDASTTHFLMEGNPGKDRATPSLLEAACRGIPIVNGAYFRAAKEQIDKYEVEPDVTLARLQPSTAQLSKAVCSSQSSGGGGGDQSVDLSVRPYRSRLLVGWNVVIVDKAAAKALKKAAEAMGAARVELAYRMDRGAQVALAQELRAPSHLSPTVVVHSAEIPEVWAEFDSLSTREAAQAVLCGKDKLPIVLRATAEAPPTPEPESGSFDLFADHGLVDEPAAKAVKTERTEMSAVPPPPPPPRRAKRKAAEAPDLPPPTKASAKAVKAEAEVVNASAKAVKAEAEVVKQERDAPSPVKRVTRPRRRRRGSSDASFPPVEPAPADKVKPQLRRVISILAPPAAIPDGAESSSSGGSDDDDQVSTALAQAHAPGPQAPTKHEADEPRVDGNGGTGEAIAESCGTIHCLRSELAPAKRDALLAALRARAERRCARRAGGASSRKPAQRGGTDRKRFRKNKVMIASEHRPPVTGWSTYTFDGSIMEAVLADEAREREQEAADRKLFEDNGDKKGGKTIKRKRG